MPASRRPPRLMTPVLLAGGMLAGGLLATAPAGADSVIAADPQAQNVSAYDTTSAWSRLDADGVHTARNGRYIVSSRCTAAAGHGCDVYGDDVRTRTERRLTAISTRERSERAPSYFKGTIAFVRNGSHHGLYVARRGHRQRRIASFVPGETDVSATHVISGNDVIRLSELDGGHARDLDQTYGGEAAYSLAQGPVLSRSRAFWISSGGEYTPEIERFAVSVVSVSTRDATSPRERGDRAFAEADMTTIALGPSGTPELYSGALGISRIDPLLAFAS